jgi:hypothetical protein
MRADQSELGEDYWMISCTNLSCPSNQIDSRWLVTDPKDPAVVERIEAALVEGRFSSSLRAVALAVLDALAAPGGEPDA